MFYCINSNIIKIIIKFELLIIAKLKLAKKISIYCEIIDVCGALICVDFEDWLKQEFRCYQKSIPTTLYNGSK